MRDTLGPGAQCGLGQRRHASENRWHPRQRHKASPYSSSANRGTMAFQVFGFPRLKIVSAGRNCCGTQHRLTTSNKLARSFRGSVCSCGRRCGCPTMKGLFYWRLAVHRVPPTDARRTTSLSSWIHLSLGLAFGNWKEDW